MAPVPTNPLRICQKITYVSQKGILSAQIRFLKMGSHWKSLFDTKLIRYEEIGDTCRCQSHHPAHLLKPAPRVSSIRHTPIIHQIDGIPKSEHGIQNKRSTSFCIPSYDRFYLKTYQSIVYEVWLSLRRLGFKSRISDFIGLVGVLAFGDVLNEFKNKRTWIYCRKYYDSFKSLLLHPNETQCGWVRF